MSIHRLFKRQSPLQRKTRKVAFLFLLLLTFGCGEETVDNPLDGSVNEEGKTEQVVPISIPYYPMTLGSRWVYRNPDGSEWAREVIQSEIIEHDSYHSFTYNPPLAGEHPDFIKSPTYVVTPDGIFLQTKKNDINDAIWQTVLQSEGSGWGLHRKYSKGVWTTRREHDDMLVFLGFSKIKVSGHSVFTLLHFPPDYPQTRKVIHMAISGKDNTSPHDYVHEFETKVSIWGKVSFEPVVTTPIGRFENCLKLEYSTEATPVETLVYEIGEWKARDNTEDQNKALLEHLEDELNRELTVLLPMLMQNLNMRTMWLAPGIGPVKIETPDCIAELIDYEIKPVASSQ